MPVSREQAQMLTALAVAARPNGAPRWDEAGVMAEIGKVKDRTLADVILAVIRAADDREAKTPGVISAPGSKHWRERGADRPAPRNVWPDDAHRCRTCSLSKPDHDRREANMPEHTRHDFEAAVGDRRLPADQAREVVGELRDHKAADPPPRPEPEVGTQGTTRVQPVRAAIAARKEDGA